MFRSLLQLSILVACDQNVAKADQHRVGVVMVHKEHPDPCTEAHVCTLIAALHDGPVDACNQPCAQEAADEQPGEAGTQAQQHVVEKQEVVEVVEGFPVVESQGLLLVSRVQLGLQEKCASDPHL